MRHAAVLSGLLGVAGVASFVTGLQPPTARPEAVPAAALTQARTAQYRGVRLPVPDGWDVHRLDLDPARCVRHDRRAIYLGRPGPQPDCPARLFGGAETLHIEPLGERSGDAASAQRRRTPVVRAGKLARFTVRENVGNRVRIELPEVGAVVTGVYGGDPLALQSVIRSIRLAGKWVAEPPPRTRGGGIARDESTAATLNSEDSEWTKGKGFDTCTAPSLRAMAAWRRAYRIANIYIGGASRGCAQPNLTRSWVRAVRRMGYRLIPTYVGKQAPCNMDAFRVHFKAEAAAREGRRAAADAIAKARALGIPPDRPIYFDMESYPSGKTRCRRAVLTFLDNWSRSLEAQNYVSGVYSSASSGVRDLGRAKGITKPQAIWFAQWDNKAKAYGGPYLRNRWWHPHRRIKQYRGGHREKHGGVALSVDNNYVDGRVY
ncbi:DUF1906 domain-containing protein [Actinomadura fulvescens]|uniref:Rv2525c-like glycoside hydrolase-like domain-containing protein n=1 Tax=Actinomadura fulvescens TaxID=46160 RepID=A0ABN3PAN1_9ACTN